MARMLQAPAVWIFHPHRGQHLTIRQHGGDTKEADMYALLSRAASPPLGSDGTTMPQIITISRLQPEVSAHLHAQQMRKAS